MSLQKIYFHVECSGIKLRGKKEIRNWIGAFTAPHSQKIELLNFIFVNDEELLKINSQYLKHNYYTDIITFNQSDKSEILEGDIFISIDRLIENSHLHGATPFHELCRLIAHGVLHLLGYEDKLPADKLKMTELEDEALLLLPQYVSRGTLEINYVS